MKSVLIRDLQKVYVNQNIEIRDPFPHVTLNHHLPWTPYPLVTPHKVTNFEQRTSRPLMHILGLVFAKMCIFSTQNLSSTLKSRKTVVITTFKVILMRLLIQFVVETIFWRSDITLWLIPPPLCQNLSSFWSSPSPSRQVRYSLNDPNAKCGHVSSVGSNEFTKRSSAVYTWCQNTI